MEAQQLIRGLGNSRLALDIVGADMVEVSPPYDSADITSLAGANILFELLCVVSESLRR